MKFLFFLITFASMNAYSEPIDLFPMQEGRVWTYKVTRTDGTPGGCAKDGILTRTVSSFTSQNEISKSTIKTDPWCWGGSGKSIYTFNGNFLKVDGYNLLKFPPKEDDSWSAGLSSGASYKWVRSISSLTVEAGTFCDCWEVKQIGYNVRGVYCKNVGLVTYTQNAWDVDEQWELLEYR